MNKHVLSVHIPPVVINYLTHTTRFIFLGKIVNSLSQPIQLNNPAKKGKLYQRLCLLSPCQTVKLFHRQIFGAFHIAIRQFRKRIFCV